jgi:putative OmpL-like beta-barrel porin-2
MRYLIFVLALPGAVHAQGAPPDTAKITFGGFVDGYYAWDFGRPPSFDRSFAGGTLFTTQPARHNEFNVNLAFIEAKLDAPRVRGRLALQAGTSVQSNYSGEPTNGSIAGPSLARHLQEAYAGVKLGNSVWLDAGVIYSHMGMEGWVSRDNPTYTRSLVAEYSPYYQSGARITWAASPTVTAQLDVVNGWQNTSENNSGKGAGVRLDLTPTSSTTLSYYNFFSDEAGNRLRTFNGVGAKVTSGRMTLVSEFDLGTQGKSSGDGRSATWYGLTAVGRAQVTPTVSVSGRVERYDDKNQIIVSTGARADGTTNDAFRVNGGSIGFDVSPQPRVLWRTELRAFANKSAIFPDGATGEPNKVSAFVVSSLAVTF